MAALEEQVLVPERLDTSASMATSGQPFFTPELLDMMETRLRNALALGFTDAKHHWALAIALWQQGNRRAAEETAHSSAQSSADVRSLSLLPRLIGDGLPSDQELMEAFVVAMACSGEDDVMHPDDHFDVDVPDADCDGPVRFEFDT